MILQPPGEYEVALKIGGAGESAGDGSSIESAGDEPLGDEPLAGGTLVQTLEVRKDPHSEGTLADIRVQKAMLEALRADYETAAELVNRVEWVRRQLRDAKAVLEDRGDDASNALAAAADSLDERLIAAEQGLFQMRATGTGQDGIRYPTRVIERLGYLFATVSVGDFPPTDQQGDVHAVLRERLLRIRDELESLLGDDLAEFNRRVQALGLGVIS